MENKWQDKVDETLKRIERQSDDTETQEGYASNFREKVLLNLVKIDMTLKEITDDLKQHIVDNKEFERDSKNDRTEIKKCLTDLPEVKKNLTNHLVHHDRLAVYVLYPIGVSIMLAALAAFAKLILHVF